MNNILEQNTIKFIRTCDLPKMCNCSSFRENCVTHARMHAPTHARTHAHGANYNLPPASQAGDNRAHRDYQHVLQTFALIYVWDKFK